MGTVLKKVLSLFWGILKKYTKFSGLKSKTVATITSLIKFNIFIYTYAIKIRCLTNWLTSLLDYFIIHIHIICTYIIQYYCKGISFEFLTTFRSLWLYLTLFCGDNIKFYNCRWFQVRNKIINSYMTLKILPEYKISFKL